MYMVDRQWRMMASMRSTISSQADDLRALRTNVQEVQNQIDAGIAVTSADDASAAERLAVEGRASKGASSVADDPFRRARLAQEKDDFAEGDWYVRSFSASLKTITPFVSSDADASTVQSYVIESLLQRNPDTLEWDGLLAK